MISLEQVKLLESKVTRTIDYVKKVTEENSSLKNKLDSCQKRIDELEVLVNKFNEDQSRIEEGILSALNRLNQFEDALDSKLSNDSVTPAIKEKPVPAEQPKENLDMPPPSGQAENVPELEIF